VGRSHLGDRPMIETKQPAELRSNEWQNRFVELLPEIKQRLRLAFFRLAPEAREDAMAEAVAHCLLAYVRLHEQGRTEVATASSLAWYSSRQVKRGRPAVGRMNGKEPLSRYALVGSGIRFERKNGEWIDKLAEDKRASVADQVAAKLDVRAWFATLTQGMRQIAKDLAYGCSTSEVALKHGVTAGRISQLRRKLEESWLAFQQQTTPALAQ
jgi:hypothetical protein